MPSRPGAGRRLGPGGKAPSRLCEIIVPAAVVAPILGPTNPVRCDAAGRPEPAGPQLEDEEVIRVGEILRAGGPAPYPPFNPDPSSPPPQDARFLVAVPPPLMPLGVGDRMAALLVEQGPQLLEGVGQRPSLLDFDSHTHVTRLIRPTRSRGNDGRQDVEQYARPAARLALSDPMILSTSQVATRLPNDTPATRPEDMRTTTGLSPEVSRWRTSAGPPRTGS